MSDVGRGTRGSTDCSLPTKREGPSESLWVWTSRIKPPPSLCKNVLFSVIPFSFPINLPLVLVTDFLCLVSPVLTSRTILSAFRKCFSLHHILVSFLYPNFSHVEKTGNFSYLWERWPWERNVILLIEPVCSNQEISNNREINHIGKKTGVWTPCAFL